MTNNMRIVLFSGNYNYVTDGANMALNTLVSYLERNGADVLVYSPTSPRPAFKPAGTLISVGSIPVPGRGEYRIGFGLSDKLKRQIRNFKPNLFHLSAPDVLGHSALKFAKTLGVPAVASFHTRFDTYLRYYGLGWAESFCRKKMTQFYDRCQHVYVPSRSIGEALIKDGIVGDNMRIWSRGVDREKFNPAHRDMAWRRSLGVDDEEIVLGFVGRLVREKGLDDFAALVEKLVLRGLPVKALVVGEGPERKSVRKRLPDAVMTGHLSGDNLAQAYASCDLFINPSLTETFGNVTLEAMASGLTTICLDATGSADLVQNGKTGLLVEGIDSAAWIDGTAELCQNHALRRQMGQSARRASGAYDWERIMPNLLKQYRDVIENTKMSTSAAAE